MRLDEIKPRRSVGVINIGMKQEEVTRELGCDFDRTADADGDVAIEYSKLGLTFTFAVEWDFRLIIIGVERPTATLVGKNLWGLSKLQVEQFVAETLETTVSELDGCTHDDGSVQEWIDVESHDLSFWFIDDSLYLVDVFCESVGDDEPIWP